MKNSTTYCSISVHKFHSHSSQYAEFIHQNVQFTELGHIYNYHDIKLAHITLVALFVVKGKVKCTLVHALRLCTEPYGPQGELEV